MRWRLPGRLSRDVAMTYHGGLLVAGGLQPGDVSSDQVWRIDPETGAHRRLGTLADPVHDAAGGVLQGRPTVLGGGASSSLSVVQQGTGRWRVTGHLPGPRSDLSATSLGNGLVVVGGYDGVHSPRTVLQTSDGRHFHVVARLPHGVRYAGVAALHGQVWVLGGEENGRELREVYRVDLSSGRVTRAGRLPGPLGHEAVVAVGDRLLVLGGRPSLNSATDRVWWFSPSTGRWRPGGRLPYPVADAPVVTVAGSTYLLGGERPSFTDRVTRLRWSR
ncbi:MAG TPA: kelch repeat-containing protein [Nocardioidaceae bacterium]|nr:kelch repeat-containing protein [Nocardioidaceae bacterium]